MEHPIVNEILENFDPTGLIYSPFITIPFPITEKGQGPADTSETVFTFWEVWDSVAKCVAIFRTQEEAVAKCEALNERYKDVSSVLL